MSDNRRQGGGAALSLRCYAWAFSDCGEWELLSSCGHYFSLP